MWKIMDKSVRNGIKDITIFWFLFSQILQHTAEGMQQIVL